MSHGRRTRSDCPGPDDLTISIFLVAFRAPLASPRCQPPNPEPVMRKINLRFDPLEARDVPAIIHWTNDGVNDHFGEVFGAQAGEARAVVRAAIDAWENVISDFNNLN